MSHPTLPSTLSGTTVPASEPARFRRFYVLAAAATGIAITMPASGDIAVHERVVEERVDSEEVPFRIVEVAGGLEHPWAVAWLPDGRMLVTERAGRLHLIDGESARLIEGLPKIDADEDQKTAPEGGNQGGLLDVAVHPDYAENGWIYFVYSSPGDAVVVAGT